MAKKAIVIDGNSLVYRAFYATWQTLDYYKKNNLTPTNALKLTASLILKLLDFKEYDYALVAFDHHKKTFRNEVFAEYKANRKSTPEELLVQLPLIRKMINDLGVKTMSIEGFEADDIVGSFANLANANGIEVEVFTSDRDLLQLVNEKTSVNLFKTGVSEILSYTHDNFCTLCGGLKPKQIIDYKAIVGDGSDNFPGVKGIGPKAATTLLLKYSSFSEIYGHIEELSVIQKQKFVSGKEIANICYEIATIKTNLFDTQNVENFIKKPMDKNNFNKMVKEFHFKGFEKYLN